MRDASIGNRLMNGDHQRRTKRGALTEIHITVGKTAS